MSSERICDPSQTPERVGDVDETRWHNAAKRLDRVAAALFEGDYIEAMRLARIAAREMRDAAGPDHPDYAELDAITRKP